MQGKPENFLYPNSPYDEKDNYKLSDDVKNQACCDVDLNFT